MSLAMPNKKYFFYSLLLTILRAITFGNFSEISCVCGAGGFSSTGLVDPMWARNKRQLYKDTTQWSRIRIKTKARVRFAINS